MIYTTRIDRSEKAGAVEMQESGHADIGRIKVYYAPSSNPRFLKPFSALCKSEAAHVLPTMPIESHHPPISTPPVDVWTFLFERIDRDYPDDHGICLFPLQQLYPKCERKIY